MRNKITKSIISWVLTIIIIACVFTPLSIILAEDNLGQTYYVAMNGKDTNPGTKEEPFATIHIACSKLSAGDTLYIREGTYNGYMVVSKKDNITIKNYNDEKVTIKNGIQQLGYIAYIGESQNVSISGIAFTYEETSNSGSAIIIHNSNNTKINNCELYKVDCGVMARAGTDNFEISSNIMHDCTWAYGGMLIFEAANGRIFNNVIYDSYFGVNFYGRNSHNNIVYNNTFFNNTLDVGSTNVSGIAENNIFRNNIFSSHFENTYETVAKDTADVATEDTAEAATENVAEDIPLAAIETTSEDTNEVQRCFITMNDFDYNCYNINTLSDGIIAEDPKSFDNTTTFTTFQTCGQEKNGFLGNPAFLNPGIGELQIGRMSECKGKGTDEYVPDVDILGKTREGSVDIGAYTSADRVDYYVSVDGSDENSGKDAKPFKTIQHALSVLQSGDFLFIKEGSYAEPIKVVGRSNITIMNYQDDKPVLNGQITIQDSNSISVGGFALNKSVVIDNSKKVKVTNMDINNGHIVVVPGSGACTDEYEISSCIIHDFGGDGAILIYNGKNGSIFNNVVYNTKQALLFEGSEAVNNKIYNNTFYNNQADVTLISAASMGDPANNKFYNNIFSNGFEIGNVKLLDNHEFDYNFYNEAKLSSCIGYWNVYNEKGEHIEVKWSSLNDFKALGKEANSVLGDPAFLNQASYDFRLRSSSKCIGAATSEGAPLYDIKGNRRESPYDMGAYKFTGVVNNYYVSPDGSDSNKGTEELPFKTIQHAVDIMFPGETVFLKVGTYNESVNINNKNGNASEWFYIKNVPGEAVTISSSGQSKNAISINNSSFWQIKGIYIKDFTENGINIQDSSKNIQLVNMEISDVASNGIFARNTSNCTIDGVRVSKILGNGVSINDSTGWLINKSCINDVGDAAILADSSSKCKVITNLIMNSKNNGIELRNSNNLIMYNNSFYGNSNCEMLVENKSTMSTVKNNIFGSSSCKNALVIADTESIGNDFDYNCYNITENEDKNTNEDKSMYIVKYIDDETEKLLTLSEFQKLGKEENAIIGNPLYYDCENGDLSLKSGSSCAKKGIKDDNSPTSGYDGVSYQIPMDIGAFYYPYSNNVYYVSPEGNDSNDGSITKPWKTVSKGLNSLRQSDTLYIREGKYNERINLYDKKGTSKTPYTVKNYPGENVVLDSEFSQGVGIKFTNCSYWHIDGLKFCDYSGAAIWTTASCEHIVMENLEIWNIDEPKFVTSGTEGILGEGSSYCTVRNCYIHDIGMTRRALSDHGIYIGYGAHHWTFDSNTIENVPGGGIHLYGKPIGGDDCIIVNNIIANCRDGLVLTMAKRNLISNNTFYNNWVEDLYMDWWFNDSIIQNNIFYNDLPVGMKVMVEDKANQTTKEYEIDPVSFAFYCEDVKDNIFRNNIVINENFGNRVINPIRTKKPIQEHIKEQNLNTFEKIIEGDPMFVNTECENFKDKDFRLMDGSPCIDAGISDKVPEVDIIGTVRVNSPDLGAYEKISSTAVEPFTISNTSINVNNGGISATAAVTRNTKVAYSGDSVVIFQLMKKGQRSDFPTALVALKANIQDTVVLTAQFASYNDAEYYLKIMVWDKLDNSFNSIGIKLAEPVEILQD